MGLVGCIGNASGVILPGRHSRFDTVFVVRMRNQDLPGMAGLLVARVRSLSSSNQLIIDDYHGETVPCALVSWFAPDGPRS